MHGEILQNGYMNHVQCDVITYGFFAIFISFSLLFQHPLWIFLESHQLGMIYIYIIDIPLAIGMCILIYGLIKPISSRFSLFVIYLPPFISNFGEI